MPGEAVSQRDVTTPRTEYRRANGPLNTSNTGSSKMLAPLSVFTRTLCSPLGSDDDGESTRLPTRPSTHRGT